MNNQQKRALLTDIAIPPGEFLLETIEEMGITQVELAQRMGRPTQAINEIIKGRKAITAETAFQLENVLGTPAYVWVNLESDYQLNKARLERIKALGTQVEKLGQFPLTEMIKHGWIQRFRNKTEQLEELLRFFGVASLNALESTRYFEATYQVVYRKSERQNSSRYSMVAWLRRGWIEANAVETNDFNEKKLESVLTDIRPLTLKNPEEFALELREVMASCGVAMVFVPHLSKSYVSGATYWLNPNKAVIQLSLRFKTNDHFWFSLYHEVAHLLLHGRKIIFLDDGQIDNKMEAEADELAASKLIRNIDYIKFLKANKKFSKRLIDDFAEHINIAPGILVGRLQHDGYLPYTHLNDLKEKFDWATNIQEERSVN